MDHMQANLCLAQPVIILLNVGRIENRGTFLRFSGHRALCHKWGVTGPECQPFHKWGVTGPEDQPLHKWCVTGPEGQPLHGHYALLC